MIVTIDSDINGNSAKRNMENDGIFGELGKIDVKNRCSGIGKDGKKCRTRLRKNQYLFCCEAHKPHNKEIMEDGCFCCMEKLINHKDILYFRCRHLVHKKCYYEWMEASQNEVAICMICRSPVFGAKNVVENGDGVLVNGDEIESGVEKIMYVDPTPPEDKPIFILEKACMAGYMEGSSESKQFESILFRSDVPFQFPDSPSTSTSSSRSE